MRTTIDIPEELLRLAKSRAALRGICLKDFASDAIRLALIENDSYSATETASVNNDLQVLSDNYSFPIIRGRCGPAMQDLSSDRIHEILEANDNPAISGQMLI